MKRNVRYPLFRLLSAAVSLTVLMSAFLNSSSVFCAAETAQNESVYYQAAARIEADTEYLIVMSGITPTGSSGGSYAMLNDAVSDETGLRNFASVSTGGSDEVSENYFWIFEETEGGYAIRTAEGTGTESAYLNMTASGLTLGDSQTLTVTISDSKLVISREINGTVYYVRFTNSGGASGKTPGFTAGTKSSSNEFKLYQMIKYNADPLPDTSEEPLYTIACISDLHTDYGIQNWDPPIRAGIIATCNAMRATENANVMLVGGDITSNNAGLDWTKAVYDKSMAEIYKVTGSATASGRTLFATGNHDFVAGGTVWNSGDYLDNMLQNVGSFDDVLYQEDDTITSYHLRHVLAFHYVIDGLDFIVINTPYNGTDNHSSYVYTDETVAWVGNMLEKIGADKTVVVMGHYPFRDSRELSSESKGMAETYDTSLKAIFENYPNLIYLYGHDHGGAYIDSDTFERVTPYDENGTPINARVSQNTGFVSCFMGSMGYYSGSLSAEQPAVVQALIVNIYSDRVSFTMKNYGESTGSSAQPLTYSIAKQVKLSGGDALAAQGVVDMIAALGTITSLESKTAVEAARSAYNALTDTQKALVTNYSDLQDAETAVANLQAVADVIAQIAALGTVTSLDSKTAVEAARAAYNTLTDTQKTGVTNYNALTAAEDTIAELENSGAVKRGDVDGDGNITVSDVVELRGVIMAGSPTANQLTAGDLDGSGALTVSDVVDLRDYIMKGIFN